MGKISKKNSDGISPMMSQYLLTKENYKDCIVFYRLGDFYEMFFEDAIKASKLLDLTLTGRNYGKEERAPMCGVPYHAADTYIAKLVSMGEKVAICEQLSEPKKGEVVDRDIVKIVTAGTITENSLLDENKNNFILSISQIDSETSISWADITTGEFYSMELVKNAEIYAIFDLLSKINPAEIICNQKVFQKFYNLKEITSGQYPKFSLYKEWAFNPNHAVTTLKNHFNVKNLTSFGIENNDVIISSSGALIEYLSETQKRALVNINKITVEDDSNYLKLDSVAIRNLELTKTMRDGKRYGSLLWLLDATETPMGSRNLTSWITSPLLSIEKINYRLDGVEELFKNVLMKNAVKDVLNSIRDTERLSGKISNNNITPRDCLQLVSSLSAFPSLKFTISGATSKILNDVNENIFDFTELTSLLSKAINPEAPINLKDGGYIANGFDKELDRLRSLSKNTKETLDNMLEKERERTGIKNLKIGYNKVFGYYLEVTNSFKDKVLSFFATHKYTKDLGGSQDNQYKDVQEFHTEAKECIDNNYFLLSITDGKYYLSKESGLTQNMSKIQYLNTGRFKGDRNCATNLNNIVVDIVPVIKTWLRNNFEEDEIKEMRQERKNKPNLINQIFDLTLSRKTKESKDYQDLLKIVESSGLPVNG